MSNLWKKKLEKVESRRIHVAPDEEDELRQLDAYACKNPNCPVFNKKIRHWVEISSGCDWTQISYDGKRWITVTKNGKIIETERTKGNVSDLYYWKEDEDD